MTAVPPEAVTIEDRRAALVAEWNAGIRDNDCIVDLGVISVAGFDLTGWAERAAVVLADLGAAERRIRAQVYDEIRQLATEVDATYDAPCPSGAEGCVHQDTPFADLIGSAR